MARETDRIQQHTEHDLQQRIDRAAELRVLESASHSDGLLTKRIHELEEEWDVDRTLIAMAATNFLVGLTLAHTVNRKWLLFPTVVSGFLLLHAFKGWCPPLVLLRRLGRRSRDEINQEKYALKALRGDFEELPATASADKVARARKAWEAAQS